MNRKLILVLVALTGSLFASKVHAQSVTLSSTGVLTVSGTDAREWIHVQNFMGQTLVYIEDLDTGAFVIPPTLMGPTSGISIIFIDAQGGDDDIELGGVDATFTGLIHTVTLGGWGNDFKNGSPVHFDYFQGNGGFDTTGASVNKFWQ